MAVKLRRGSIRKRSIYECYDEWLKSDGNFTDVLEYAVEERIDLIIEDFERQKHKKDKER